MVISNHFLVNIWFIIIIQFDSQPFYKCLALGLPGMSFLSSKIWNLPLHLGLASPTPLRLDAPWPPSCPTKDCKFPGDSSRALFIPKRWRPLNHLWKGHVNSPAELRGSVHFLVQNWFESSLCSIFLSPKNKSEAVLFNELLPFVLKESFVFFWCLGKKKPWIFLHVPPPQIAKPGFAAPLVVALPGGSKVVEKTT